MTPTAYDLVRLPKLVGATTEPARTLPRSNIHFDKGIHARPVRPFGSSIYNLYE
jgi:hypothetical protein